ncbi:MAG: hypothetical protein JEZ09_09910 [Salinivirgaceae bacterium]|nr:hypothetical protein [Salinivirgaceae bacterium]
MRILFILIFILVCWLLMVNSVYWQIIPLAVLLIFFSAYAILYRKGIFKQKLTNRFWIINSSLVLLMTILIYFLLPFFNLPIPTGKYEIGTKYFTIDDTSRIDLFSNDSPNIRRLHCQIWYPAKIAGDVKPEMYIPEAKKFSKIFAKSQSTPCAPFILNHLGRTKTSSYLNAKIISIREKFPVIIFSHGLGQFYKFNTTLIEELTSHGYFVVAITHPYDAPGTVNSNNELVIYSSNLPPHDENKKTDSQVDMGLLFKKIQSSDSIEELRELYKIFYNNQPADWNQRNSSWKKDILFTITKLNTLNTEVFNNSIDLNAIGVMGFSFGGGAAGLVAMSDSTIKAGINLDGWQSGHTNENYFKCPFMMVSSEQHTEANDFFLKYSKQLVYDITIAGTKHTNFNDMAIISGKLGRILGHTGEIENDHGLNILKGLIIPFFNQNLKSDKTQNLLDSLNNYPEISYKTSCRGESINMD